MGPVKSNMSASTGFTGCLIHSFVQILRNSPTRRQMGSGRCPDLWCFRRPSGTPTWRRLLRCPCADAAVCCRVEAGGQEPLALRQLLWLDEDLFVAVISGLLPTSSTVLVLRPAGDADHALAVRWAGPGWTTV